MWVSPGEEDQRGSALGAAGGGLTGRSREARCEQKLGCMGNLWHRPERVWSLRSPTRVLGGGCEWKAAGLHGSPPHQSPQPGGFYRLWGGGGWIRWALIAHLVTKHSDLEKCRSWMKLHRWWFHHQVVHNEHKDPVPQALKLLCCDGVITRLDGPVGCFWLTENVLSVLEEPRQNRNWIRFQWNCIKSQIRRTSPGNTEEKKRTKIRPHAHTTTNTHTLQSNRDGKGQWQRQHKGTA